MKQIINWYKQSNKWLHCLLGIGMLLVNISISMFINISFIDSFIISFINSYITMLVLEIKDVQHKCKFDWNDVLAGMTIYIIISVIILISLWV